MGPGSLDLSNEKAGTHAEDGNMSSASQYRSADDSLSDDV
jgi:hypothetical protein